LVLDVSRRGLFVQTSVAAKTGDEVEIMLSSGEQEADIVLNAEVRWQRRVPLQLRSALAGGIGLQIRYASESYYVLLAGAAKTSPPAGPGTV